MDLSWLLHRSLPVRATLCAGALLVGQRQRQPIALGPAPIRFGGLLRPLGRRIINTSTVIISVGVVVIGVADVVVVGVVVGGANVIGISSAPAPRPLTASACSPMWRPVGCAPTSRRQATLRLPGRRRVQRACFSQSSSCSAGETLLVLPHPSAGHRPDPRVSRSLDYLMRRWPSRHSH